MNACRLFLIAASITALTSVILSGGSAAAQDPFSDSADPFSGGGDPFSGGGDPFSGGDDPFSGGGDPFSDPVDAFSGNVEPSSDAVEPSSDGVEPSSDGVEPMERIELFNSLESPSAPSTRSDVRASQQSVAMLRQARALYRANQRVARLEHNLWMGYQPLRPKWNAVPMMTSRYGNRKIYVPVYIRTR